jgi:hypothetical protein
MVAIGCGWVVAFGLLPVPSADVTSAIWPPQAPPAELGHIVAAFKAEWATFFRSTLLRM